MKRIGSGWQYTVYDLGNGRVLKKFNHPLKTLLIFLWDAFPYRRHPIWVGPQYVRSMKRNAERSKKWFEENLSNRELFGNPIFLDDLGYEQDKVIILKDHLKLVDEDEGRQVIDDFVSFNKTLLSIGVIDKSFRIGNNFGMTENGNIVMVDLGELFSGKDTIKKRISKRPWSYSYVVNEVPKNLRKYFLERMDNTFLKEI